MKNNLAFGITMAFCIFFIYYYIKTCQIKINEGFDNGLNQSDWNSATQWDPLWLGKSGVSNVHGRTSPDCYKESKRNCMKFSNCGLCMKDGKSDCIPGDEQGPFFKEDCQHWGYTNYYDGHIFGDIVQGITRPWNHFYPEYEARYPSPTSRASLL